MALHFASEAKFNADKGLRWTRTKSGREGDKVGLAQGCCVVTGTSFDLPMVLQIDPLEKAKRPDSEDVDLEALWVEPVAAPP